MSSTSDPGRDDNRRRLLGALCEVTARYGYGGLTIETVSEDAGLDAFVFHEYFVSIEECYLAAMDQAAEELAQAIAWACEGIGDWPLEVRVAIATALEFFAASPSLAPLLLSEPFFAAPPIFTRHREQVSRLVPFLARGRAFAMAGGEVPVSLEPGLLGSLASRISRQVRGGEAEKLPGLAPELTQFVLTPYLGQAVARRVSQS